MARPLKLTNAKPCPFCGNFSETDDDLCGIYLESNGPSDDGDPPGVFWMKCDCCESEGPLGSTPGEAMKQWNKREAARGARAFTKVVVAQRKE